MNRDLTHLIPKQTMVSRGGSTFMQTVYISPEEANANMEKDNSPSEHEHKKILAGDRKTLGEYCYKVLWKRDGGASRFARYATSGYASSNIEDVMQEATIAMMNSQELGRLKGISREKLPKYIASVVHNIARHMAHRHENINVSTEGIEEHIVDGENLLEQKDVQISLKTMSTKIMESIENPVHRQVFAYFLSGMKHAEIGQKLDISENTSKQVIKRLNETIRETMKENGYEGERDAAKVFRDQYRHSIGEYKVAARPLHDRMEFQGLPISIENQAGSVRTGINENGKPWATIMDFPYGYIRKTNGADGEHIDCYVGPNQTAQNVFVIHQKNPLSGEYDEDKVMLGFDDAGDAAEAYFNHYDDPEFFDSMSHWPIDQFKDRVFTAKGPLTKADLPIGHISVHSDGTSWMKVAPDRWAPVKKKEGTDRHDIDKSRKAYKEFKDKDGKIHRQEVSDVTWEHVAAGDLKRTTNKPESKDISQHEHEQRQTHQPGELAPGKVVRVRQNSAKAKMDEALEGIVGKVRKIGAHVSEIVNAAGKVFEVPTNMLALVKAMRVGAPLEYAESSEGLCFLSDSLTGAAYRMQGGVIVLRKAKLEVGAVRTWQTPTGPVEMQKTGDGKWEPIKGKGGDKGGKDEKKGKKGAKIVKPKGHADKKTEGIAATLKTSLKDAFKGLAETFSSAYAGESTTGAVTGAIQKQGENLADGKRNTEKPPEATGKAPAGNKPTNQRKAVIKKPGEPKPEKPAKPAKKPDDEE